VQLEVLTGARKFLVASDAGGFIVTGGRGRGADQNGKQVGTSPTRKRPQAFVVVHDNAIRWAALSVAQAPDFRFDQVPERGRGRGCCCKNPATGCRMRTFRLADGPSWSNRVYSGQTS